MASTSQGRNNPLPSTRDQSPPDSAYLGETATIEVSAGANKKTFHVHSDLLSFYSGYFKAALNGRFAEARTGVIELETEEPAVFLGFVKWLYTQKARTDAITDDNKRDHYKSIFKLLRRSS